MPTMTAAPLSSAPKTETIAYLAFGSNLSPVVLTGRRKVKPIESYPVIVPGYWLSFDIGGIPFIEPCFASILAIDHSRLRDRVYAEEIHARTKWGREFVWDESHPDHPMRSYPPVLQGVVHLITLREWELVIHSEGGWGYDIPTGYNQIEVECELVGKDNKRISAMVLEARPASVKSHCQPTARYKGLLTSGAAHHNLDPAYQRYLEGIVPYECTGTRSKVARVLFSAMNTPLMFMFLMMFLRNRGKSADQIKRPPYWAAWCFDKGGRLSALIHDYVIAPIFGSGRTSSPAHQAVVRKRIEIAMLMDKVEECNTKAVESEGPMVKVAEEAVESVAE